VPPASRRALAPRILQSRHQFSIPAQSLDTALLAFSDQAKVQVLMWGGDRSGARSAGAMGDLVALDAQGDPEGHRTFVQADRPETIAIVAPESDFQNLRESGSDPA
jgi:hypothetical protein